MRIIDKKMCNGYEIWLQKEEKSCRTVEKYMRDLRCFCRFLGGRSVNKSVVLEYKAWLGEHYSITSANSMLAAINSFFRYRGWRDCVVRHYRIQKKIYSVEARELSREEYYRLVKTAQERNTKRLEMILQTICATGIRVGELQFITAEAVDRGEAEVICKGKSRRVFLVRELQNRLKEYLRSENISSGPCFVTRTGKPVTRSSVWREMKRLCFRAEVPAEKVFPHNLRHLFARIFYGLEKDIAKLADVLGHTSIDTTRIYIMTTGREHMQKMQRMQLVV